MVRFEVACRAFLGPLEGREVVITSVLLVGVYLLLLLSIFLYLLYGLAGL